MKFAALTERDKKLLVFLAVVVIAAVFTLAVIQPLLNLNSKAGTQITDAQDQKQAMENKIMRYGQVRQEADQKQTEAGKAAAGFYPRLQSQDVDKALTDFAVAAGLKIDSMQITMPEDTMSIIPYKDSEFAKESKPADDKKTETTDQEAVVAEADGSTDTDTQKLEDGAVAKTTVLYKAEADMQVSGSRDQLWNFLNQLAAGDASLQVMSTQFTAGQQDQADSLRLTLEVYMSDQSE